VDFFNIMNTKTEQSEKQRTIQQNKALWKYFEALAQEFSDHGLDMKKVLKPEIDIPWNKNTICEFLWKPIMKIQCGKESTTELTTKEIDEIYDTINRHLSEKFGITVEWPSNESLINNSRLKQPLDNS